MFVFTQCCLLILMWNKGDNLDEISYCACFAVLEGTCERKNVCVCVCAGVCVSECMGSHTCVCVTGEVLLEGLVHIAEEVHSNIVFSSFLFTWNLQR